MLHIFQVMETQPRYSIPLACVNRRMIGSVQQGIFVKIKNLRVNSHVLQNHSISELISRIDECEFKHMLLMKSF